MIITSYIIYVITVELIYNIFIKLFYTFLIDFKEVVHDYKNIFSTIITVFQCLDE